MTELARVQAAYGKMAAPGVVEQAATQAGQTMASSMKTMVQSFPDLSGYNDVAEGFTSWRGPDTVHAGLPEDHPLVGRAHALEEEFPLMETILDMERQTGETRRTFHDELARHAGLLEQER